MSLRLRHIDEHWKRLFSQFIWLVTWPYSEDKAMLPRDCYVFHDSCDENLQLYVHREP